MPTALLDPLLLDLPASFETERLLLRAPQPGDGPAHYEALAETLPALREFLGSLPWVAGEPSVQVSEAFCRNAQSNFMARRDLPFLMFEKGSGRFVGVTGLHRPNWTTPQLELGYWCRTSASGRGFVTEAVSAAAQYAFKHAHAVRLELITDELNTSSRRVADRCGFTLEGVLRHQRRTVDGSLRNTCVYARLP